MDTYKTVKKKTGNIIFKDRGSKFIGYVFPITEEAVVKTCIEELKKEHHAARHWCYAWQLGYDQIRFRANDDGEPNNSAGQPIYGQILAHELTNVLVVVVRYFGGTKLGVGGLVNAYRSTAQLVLEEADIVTRTLKTNYLVKFEYQYMDKVMRIVKKHKLEICSQRLELDCEYVLAVRQKFAPKIYTEFTELRCLKISLVNP